MKCKYCDGTGTTKGWISEPCAYCGGTGELPNDFSEMKKLKRCKKCGGEAVFSGVFDDPPTYRFPECMECGARAEGNRVEDSWAERAKKWNEQNTPTNEEWLRQASTEDVAKWLSKISKYYHECGKRDVYPKIMYEEDWEWWLKEKHNG